MRSGRLRFHVEIQEKGAGSPRQSSSGQRADPWTAFANVRADIRPISGKERRDAGQAQGEVTEEIEIRYLAGVIAGMRVVHRSVAYTIHAVVDPKLRNKNLLLQCTSGVVND